jgi:hypothetical protein
LDKFEGSARESFWELFIIWIINKQARMILICSDPTQGAQDEKHTFLGFDQYKNIFFPELSEGPASILSIQAYYYVNSIH